MRTFSRFRIRGTGVALACSAFAACTDLTPPRDRMPTGPGPRITVDRTSYGWETDSVIRYRLTHSGSEDVWVACPSVNRQRYRNGWQDMPEIFGCPIGASLRWRLAPADTVEGTLPLTSDVIPRAGHYRLVFNFHYTEVGQSHWPLEFRVSPSFKVEP